MRRFLLPLVLFIATLNLIELVAVQWPSANGPAEWRWAYRPPGLEGLGLLAAAVVALIAVWWAAQDRPAEAPWGLALLVALGWVLTLDVARAQPGGFGRVLGSLASRNSFGFVFDEGLAPATRQLLADYPTATAGLNQHTRTHPPGALLAVRGLDQLGRRLPPALLGGLDLTAAEHLERERQRAADRHRPVPRTLADPGTLVLLALLLPALSALAAWPLYRLALRLGLPMGAALLAAALWLAVPARSLFTPSLDQALPFFLVLAAALAAGGGWGRAFAAGSVLGLCWLVSYGYLAGGVLVGLLAVVPRLQEEDGKDSKDDKDGTGARETWRQGALRLVWLAAGAALPWIALALAAGYSPWASFRAAMAMHQAIAVAPRSYATWLVWNPYDFALLLGPAVLGLAAFSIFRPGGRSMAFRAFTWGWWALLALLLLSGSVRGEAGRIWLLLMPFACLPAAGAAVERWGARSAWIALVLALQCALLLTLAANLVFVD